MMDKFNLMLTMAAHYAADLESYKADEEEMRAVKILTVDDALKAQEADVKRISAETAEHMAVRLSDDDRHAIYDACESVGVQAVYYGAVAGYRTGFKEAFELLRKLEMIPGAK